MVLLTTTPRILSAISTLSSRERLTLPDLPNTVSSPIDHNTVISLSRLTRENTLNTLLRGTQVYQPPAPSKPPPTPEYVALMSRLRKEQEQREYAALVSKQGPGIAVGLDGEEQDQGSDDLSPSLVLNILLSVVMCALTMFYLTRWWHNDGVRVLMSLGTGLIVGIAEVTVYAAYLRKVKESKDKERKKREKKVFIGEYTGEAPPVPLSHMPAHKEEIWGRGVNGGMRRRIREKWEKDQDDKTS
ncbi:hypothetical protein B0A52_00588 [Exophiala mesophila]|uniref:Endoplasmic reticulum-based factor for assembly of V-ATPase-domain-containing protein n=1 Tax=Exophiala mesophila TaxID=212818 RepID=A0A438NHP0_EXOME|nr:hypothetical protein B0A52_00588 [Exophiala mesophila]